MKVEKGDYALMPYRRLKRSTRPAVSMIFCLPVYRGWQLEQISTWISGRVERVSILEPQAHTIVHFWYAG